MRIGLIITTYNRPEYFKQCLESLSWAAMPNVEILIVDDKSTDVNTKELIYNWQHPQALTNYKINQKDKGIKSVLITGCEYFILKDLIINLDGDAIVRNDFITELVKLHESFPNHLITGFNCTTLNKDGSVRHKILNQGLSYNTKKTVGGINLAFTPKMYKDWVLPALQSPGNWDQRACLNAGNGVVCAVPSLVQHIGLISSMGHSQDQPDVADDFKPLSLPNVTLIGVDTNKERLQAAFDKSKEFIHFGAEVMLTDVQINSKEQYSKFCIQELHKYVHTSHMLIIQWDGYVKNWKAWDKDFLNYDYIGAPWEWYTDGRQVGNGGFSLRSKKLMETVSQIPQLRIIYHPEDHLICRDHRNILEVDHGMKFAPIELARKFSIEGYKHWDKKHTNQFGFHGPQVMNNIEKPVKGKIAFIEQPFGLGDVIFCVQLARNLIKQGYKAIWPVMPDLVEALNTAYPDIEFLDVNLCNLKHLENKQDKTEGSTRFIPIRWTYDIMGLPMSQCMTSKYDFMHMEWNTWRNSIFAREQEKEQRLFEELGLKEGESYTLVNRLFGTQPNRTAPMPQFEGKVIEMTIKPGYSLFDWAKVIENASEMHTVSTSIIYLLELLELKCEPHIYLRKPIEQNHSNYEHIMIKHKYHFEN